MTSKLTAFDIPHLLHDATLVSGEWDRDASRLTLVYECLRRALDGSEIEDRRVEIALDGVVAFGVAYDSSLPDIRPSELVVPDSWVVKQIDPWPFRAMEAPMSINSESDAETVELAARCDWLLGDARAASGARYRICLEYSGSPRIRLLISVAAGAISPSIGGEPFPLDLWAKQYNAWWQGWQEHWDRKEEDGEDEEGEPALEDAAIPMGEDPPPDLSYSPPREPAFELTETEAPVEVLAPLRDWFEGLLERDWARRAGAFPHIDIEPIEHARAIEQRMQGQDFGRWGYARAVDRWWVEGKRAHVRVRGIEHSMPEEDDPAENVESVWDFALRCRRGEWKIWGYSQGWPCYGSAEKKPARQKPWLQQWQSGKVKTSDDD
ncbi:MAG: hypothetical protein JXR96_08095 [Deltaproteobacteria bacterium]|nr:hypothetical protein [Deltaproteobacteria bacterium]